MFSAVVIPVVQYVTVIIYLKYCTVCTLKKVFYCTVLLLMKIDDDDDDDGDDDDDDDEMQQIQRISNFLIFYLKFFQTAGY